MKRVAAVVVKLLMPFHRNMSRNAIVAAHLYFVDKHGALPDMRTKTICKFLA